MQRFKRWILGVLLATPWVLLATAWVLLAAPAAYAATGNTVSTANVKARLVSETSAIAAGQSIWVALELDIRAGWHTYWRNPGDSGQATRIDWTLPAGFTAGDILWPLPHRFELPPLVNYGYANHAVHLVKITAPADLKSPAVDFRARASWLVCSDVCVPDGAQLTLHLPVGGSAGAIDPAAAALFAAARSQLPTPEPAEAHATLDGGQLTLTFGKAWGTTLAQVESLAFYPYDEGSIEYGAPQTLTHGADSTVLTLKAGYQVPTTAVNGVLVATQATGADLKTVAIELRAPLGAPSAPRVGAAQAAGSVLAAGAAQTADGAVPLASQSLPTLLLLAVLGGLILNLMPCVFPVLSIKALGLVEQARKHPAAVRAKGLVFAAGVLASMLALAVVLLALRAGGEKIGWGFQLQSPLFVTLMIYLLLGVGLNLSGVFDVGAGLAGAGDSLTQGDGYRAAFFTGVLTTLVATPCTAPFMAAAVGAALTQSPVVALAIFSGLGLGLSLPYLMLSFAPWLRRALPKPGAWMDTLKQVFAFPMYASAAWLLWVLAQQTSSLGLGAALAGAILVALAAWTYQKSRVSGNVGRRILAVTTAAALVLAVFLPARYADVAAATHDGAAVSGSTADAWQPYDATRLAELDATGAPVLVNFTASWCLTCLVNERNAFADAAVQTLFKDKGVILMKGDWTNRDPAITQALAAFGRAGVPLYLVYNATPGSHEPRILPQLLTPHLVLEAFAAVPRSIAPTPRLPTAGLSPVQASAAAATTRDVTNPKSANSEYAMGGR